MSEKTYASVQEMLDDSGNQEIAELFRQQQPYRELIGDLRAWWSFDDRQQPTHTWHTREDFIERRLPELVAAIVKPTLPLDVFAFHDDSELMPTLSKLRASTMMDVGDGYYIRCDMNRKQLPWTAIGPAGRIRDVATRDEALQLIEEDRAKLTVKVVS